MSAPRTTMTSHLVFAGMAAILTLVVGGKALVSDEEADRHHARARHCRVGLDSRP